MKKTIMMMLALIMCLMIATIVGAYNGDLCNQTHSPCGGGCTSTDLTNMFAGVINFDSVVGDITGWNTSCITNMNTLFDGSDFNQDISGWDTSNVIDMSYMFIYDHAFNQPIGSWNTSKVTTMSYMFANHYNPAHAFNQDLSQWDVSQVTNMYAMFMGTYKFDQNIGAWNISNVGDMRFMFYTTSLSTNNYNALLNGWASKSVYSGVRFNAGSSQYSNCSITGGITGRNILVTNYSWVITDGGMNTSYVCPEAIPETPAVQSSHAGAIAAAVAGSAGGRAANTKGFGVAQIIGLGIVGGIIAYNAGWIKPKVRGRRR